MFSEDLPHAHCRRSENAFKKLIAILSIFFEPSAGKGDLAKTILGFGRTRSPTITVHAIASTLSNSCDLARKILKPRGANRRRI